MATIDTDYLVIGAGATGMAFVDTLISETDADVVMVDRRHRPGGHWLDAYPFVRLHQPSAYYGVSSRPLGHDRIDTSGPNAGFYELGSAAEICDYFSRVLDEQLLPSGQVRFFGLSDYLGEEADGHRFVSRVTGQTTTVTVRKRLVDATYLESSVPATHTPSYTVDDGARLVTPTGLTKLDDAPSGFTVIGAGKTSMDTCTWLMANGVAPDDIRWIRPRDAWTVDRAFTQPLDLMASGSLELQAQMMSATAAASDGPDFLHRLEGAGLARRFDPSIEPEVFRFAILSTPEFDALRRIENVVRLGKVKRIGATSIELDQGSIGTDAQHVHVDCTAAGLPIIDTRPIFEPGRITLQMVTQGVTPWSAATNGYVEATRDDDEEKNRLCAPFQFSGVVSEFMASPGTGAFVRAQMARMAEPDFMAWNESCRLNPTRGMLERAGDPEVAAVLGRIMELAGAMQDGGQTA